MNTTKTVTLKKKEDGKNNLTSLFNYQIKNKQSPKLKKEENNKDHSRNKRLKKKKKTEKINKLRVAVCLRETKTQPLARVREKNRNSESIKMRHYN